MLFVRKNILSNLPARENKPIEGLYIELKLRNDKWFINCYYNPHKNTISTHINKLSESLGSFFAAYEEEVIIGNFNVEVNDNHMKSFVNILA